MCAAGLALLFTPTAAPAPAVALQRGSLLLVAPSCAALVGLLFLLRRLACGPRPRRPQSLV